MVESSWSEAQSTLTTELGAIDVIDVPRRHCVVPKVRPLQRNDCCDDQQVPEYRDQTVPVWSCKEARRRISTSSKRKRRANSVSRRGEPSLRFGSGIGGGTMVGRDSPLESGCSEFEGDREGSAGEVCAASEVS